MTRNRLLSRSAAIGLLLAIIGLPMLLVLQPLATSWAADRAALDTTRQALTAYRRAAATGKLWEARIKEIESDGTSAAGLIAASTAPEATAALQSDIRKLIQANSGELRTMQPGGTAKENELERIEAGFDLTMPADALPGFLAAFDAHDPYLFADRLDLSVEGAPNKSLTFTIHAQVHAYWRPL